MSSINSNIESLYNELENQNQSIKQKVSHVNGEWSGDAQKGFNEAHKEVEQCMRRVKSNLQSLKSLSRSLDNSIQSAERDISAKKAAKSKRR